MGKRDDDSTVDRLLEAALRARHRDAPAAATPACLEAETIAAWADRALSVSESRAVEAHLSSCPHCQQVAAVFAQSAPAAAAAPWWRRPQIRWLTPALASAAAVALVVWTSSSPDAPELAKPTAPTIARNEAASQPADAGRTAAPGAPPQARADEQAANAAARMREELQKSDQGQRAADAKAALARQQQAARLAEARDAARGGKLATPPPPPATVTAAAPPPPPPVAATPPTEPPARPVPPPAAVVNVPVGQVAGGIAQKGQGQLADAMALRAATMVVVAEFGAPVIDQRFAAAGGAAGRGGGRGGGGRGLEARQEAVSPVPPVRWRVLVTGVVEKSVDSGASWTQASIEPPLPITGGAAPHPQVCWLIGRGGVVLRSIDGVAFTRVEFPESVDLTSITASSALDATITTASGRVLNTTDGGKSWR